MEWCLVKHSDNFTFYFMFAIMWALLLRHGATSDCGLRIRVFQVRRVGKNVLIKQPQTADKWWSARADGWGSCEHGNELLGSIKGGETLDELSDY
jgi:hypothetical protein